MSYWSFLIVLEYVIPFMIGGFLTGVFMRLVVRSFRFRRILILAAVYLGCGFLSSILTFITLPLSIGITCLVLFILVKRSVNEMNSPQGAQNGKTA